MNLLHIGASANEDVHVHIGRAARGIEHGGVVRGTGFHAIAGLHQPGLQLRGERTARQVPAITREDLNLLGVCGSLKGQGQVLGAGLNQTRRGVLQRTIDAKRLLPQLRLQAQGQTAGEARGAGVRRRGVTDARLGRAAVERVVDNAELSRSGHAIGILHHQLHGAGFAFSPGSEPKEIASQLALGIQAIRVDGVDLLDHHSGQIVQGVACGREHLVTKAHGAADLAAGEIGNGLGVSVDIQNEVELGGVGAGGLHRDVARLDTADQHALVDGVAHADQHRAIGSKLGLDGHQVGQLAQQPIALVEKLRRLARL